MRGFGAICPQGSGASGQAAVETAIVMPLSLFFVLGLIQLGMMQQARLFADDAAFRGARAASMEMAQCPAIETAELAALVPTLGRADSFEEWKSTWNGRPGSVVVPKDNKRAGKPIVISTWKISDVHHPFDTPLSANDTPEMVRLQLRYYYEMQIPFVNWILARVFLAQAGIDTWSNFVDPLHPESQVSAGELPSGTVALANYDVTQLYYNKKIYVVPIYSSWSMRMFSQAAKTSDICQ
jgi:hypothetical protein